MRRKITPDFFFFFFFFFFSSPAPDKRGIDPEWAVLALMGNVSVR